MKAKAILLPIIILISTTLIVFFNSLNVPFTFDDEAIILSNPHIRSFDTFFNINNWFNIHGRPLSFLTFAVNYKLGELNPFGYHVFNIIIHIISSVSVYLILIKMLNYFNGYYKIKNNRIFIPALIGALIFAVHPLQTESVTYITQRMTSLSGMFLFLSYYSYLIFRIDKRYTFLIVSVLLFLFSFFSKQTGITLIPIIFISELLLFDKEEDKKKNAILLILFILCIGIAVLTFFTGIETRDAVLITRFEYLFTQFPLFFKYISLVYLPLGLNIDYDVYIYRDLVAFKPILSLFLLLSLLIIAWLNRKKNVLATFGLFFFFAAHSLESTVFPIKDLFVEHRMYVPIFGIILMTIAFIMRLNTICNKCQEVDKNIVESNTKVRALLQILNTRFINVAFYASVIVIVFFSILTIQRNKVWQEPLSLWSDSVSKSPNKSRPWNNLGFIYLQNNDYAEADSCFHRAITVNPSDFAALNNLGVSSFNQKKYIKALACFYRSFAANRKYQPAINNMAKMLIDIKYYSLSIRVLNYLLFLNPNHQEALYNMGLAYMNLGDDELAINTYKKLISLYPDYSDAYFNLGVIYLYLGKFEQAKVLFYDLSIKYPNDEDVLLNLAASYFNLGNKNTAVQIYKTILQINPKNNIAINNLNGILLEK